jgi:hypothetical protein
VSSPSVFELGELRRVARVGEAARAQAVAREMVTSYCAQMSSTSSQCV